MKVGVALPQFGRPAEEALQAATVAEDAGLDGVFVFDHLWAIDEPDLPALSCWPLLGAVAAETSRVVVGPLVARVSLLPAAVTVQHAGTLGRLAPGRVVVGLGAGDARSVPENEAYQVPMPPLEQRLEALAATARGVRSLGLPVWIGGRSRAVRAVALDEAEALNLWGVPPELVAAERQIPVTWGGLVPEQPGELGPLLSALAAAGARWAVCLPRYRRQDLRAAIEAVAIARGRL